MIFEHDDLGDRENSEICSSLRRYIEVDEYQK